MKHILVIIPTYNESKNIKPLVGAIAQVFKGKDAYQVDILFVDDFSPDGTGEVISGLQSHDKHIYLLSGPKEGLGKAYIRGLTYGLKIRAYFAIVTMDADLSHDPKNIPGLLAELDAGTDYAIGSRYVDSAHIVLTYSPIRRLQSRLANNIARSLIDLRVDVKDLTGGFKAIRASKLSTVPLQRINASGYVFQVSLLYEFARRNFKISEIPITFHARRYGKSKLGFRDAIEFLRLTFRLNPRARLPRMIRFTTVGASGTIVNIVVLVGLVHFSSLNVTFAYLIALETSIISNFTLNHLFTFRFVNHAKKGQGTGLQALFGKLLRYNLVSLGGVGIALLTFTLMYDKLGLNYVLADLLGIITGMSWNYWLSVKLVWRIVDSETKKNPKTDEQAQKVWD